MTLWLAENQRAMIQKIEYKDNYTIVNLSTSRKVGEKEYAYSDWGFVRLVKDAHQYAVNNVLKEKDTVVLVKAFQSKESYKDRNTGKKMYPKTPQIVVTQIELYRAGATKNERVESPSEDDIPF